MDVSGHKFSCTHSGLGLNYPLGTRSWTHRDPLGVFLLTCLLAPRVPGVISTCSVCDLPHSPSQNTPPSAPKATPTPTPTPATPITDGKATLFPLGLYLHGPRNESAERNGRARVHTVNTLGGIIRHTHVHKFLFTPAQAVTGHTHNYRDTFARCTPPPPWHNSIAQDTRVFTLTVKHSGATRVTHTCTVTQGCTPQSLRLPTCTYNTFLCEVLIPATCTGTHTKPQHSCTGTHGFLQVE